MVRFLAIIGFLAIVVVIVKAVYFFGGFYSVAANAEEPAIVQRALIHVRQASIAAGRRSLARCSGFCGVIPQRCR